MIKREQKGKYRHVRADIRALNECNKCQGKMYCVQPFRKELREFFHQDNKDPVDRGSQSSYEITANELVDIYIHIYIRTRNPANIVSCGQSQFGRPAEIVSTRF